MAVTGFYLVFTLIALGLHSWNPLWFVWIGERFANLEPGGRTGYDGQFVYYIARDWVAAFPHLDYAPYRWQRILLPALTRLLSLGQSEAVPWMLITINLASIILSTYVIAKWLEAQKLSPWYALTYALFVGTFMAYSRDLTEPLAFSLAALSVAAWLQRKYIPAMLWLALSALAKETTLVFAVGFALAEIVQRKPRLMAVALLAFLPFLSWEGFLYTQFKVFLDRSVPPLDVLPMKGVLQHLNDVGSIVAFVFAEPGRTSAFLFVAVPASCLAILALVYLGKGPHLIAMWLLLVQSIFVILLPFDVYDHIMSAGRNAMGLVVATMFALPLIIDPLRRTILFVWVTPTALWLVPVLSWAPWLSTR